MRVNEAASVRRAEGRSVCGTIVRPAPEAVEKVPKRGRAEESERTLDGSERLGRMVMRKVGGRQERVADRDEMVDQ
eukprot:CAMPEP_0174734908 /NCGR_PEP_ID=MMETSP1094-20130205/64086_1 /TAXON_ID=156173 /ORGANISM="Chrysochromulina brevifilum, Strain UTEX LB 985" /LENGTH=75 /DNA_ID=CAMNT_0015937803 /DNA_START=132 /DNA_END=360 /DNA_ORIENTATION=+